MAARNGPAGYGYVSKVLHWLTVALLATQLAVGWSMDVDDDDCTPLGDERSGGEIGDRAERRIDRREEACEAAGDTLALVSGPVGLPEVHLLLGLSILAIGVGRLAWRRVAGLPPWSGALSPGERRRSHWTERVLLALLFLIPLTGVALLASGDDALLTLHVATHLAFFTALAVHLTSNLRPAVLRRMV